MYFCICVSMYLCICVFSIFSFTAQKKKSHSFSPLHFLPQLKHLIPSYAPNYSLTLHRSWNIPKRIFEVNHVPKILLFHQLSIFRSKQEKQHHPSECSNFLLLAMFPHTVQSGKNLSKHFDISSLYDVFHSSQNELHVCLFTCILLLLFPKVSRQSVHYSIKVPITLCPLLSVTTFFMDVKVKLPKNLIIPLLPPSYACHMSGFPYEYF